MKVTQPVTQLRIDLKSTQNITLKYLGIYVIVAQYDVGDCVICISNKVEYLDK